MFWIMLFVFGPLLMIAATACADADRGGLASSNARTTAAGEFCVNYPLVIGLCVTFVGVMVAVGGLR